MSDFKEQLKAAIIIGKNFRERKLKEILETAKKKIISEVENGECTVSIAVHGYYKKKFEDFLLSNYLKHSYKEHNVVNEDPLNTLGDSFYEFIIYITPEP